MARVDQNYDICMSVDAGFNESKVTVNGLTFRIPSNILDITGKDQYIGNIRKPGYIGTSYVEGAKHLIGEQARMLLSEPEYKKLFAAKKEMMNSLDKFNTTDSEIHLMSRMDATI